MDQSLKTKISEWQSIRQLTLDLLDVIPDDKLDFTIGKNMGSLGKQYRHIGDVQLCYSEAIKTGKISFSNYKRDYSIENAKEKLKSFLQEIDKEMLKLIEENPQTKIDWFGDKLSLENHINALIQHEILHHGELIVYARTLSLTFPKSWNVWGL
ncbi:MAG: hypothetical protein CEN88_192 [Candidatus Berkelbacteria bacterium Licking1014_2]|uniref:DinB family protein n=1 Tax=Candidatus Berkelbacteria bacterium Licking1014_2 TaxID=2017146 RepID=A0A554LW52_9BACT|nr:MAG: hypothetical protein CEN88_192 [Candidatus Berkelbacteria bacterium Licking1014_2]